MTNIERHLERNDLNFLSRIVGMIFGSDEYCGHGMKGSDGVCMDCCNDLYSSPNDDLAEIVDFPAGRDTI